MGFESVHIDKLMSSMSVAYADPHKQRLPGVVGAAIMSSPPYAAEAPAR